MPPSELAAYLQVDAIRADTLPPSWNVAPTDPVYAAAQSSKGERLLGTYKWGLVPSWSKSASGGAKMINARAETLEQKFGPALSRRRCLVPAAGFFEWERREDGTKQPWFIAHGDGTPLVFAGLWEIWRPRDPQTSDGPPDDEPLRTCTIVTTSSNDTIARLHDRMPVVLAADDWDRWLDRSVTNPAAVTDLLVAAPPDEFVLRPANPKVNSVKNNGPELLVAQ